MKPIDGDKLLEKLMEDGPISYINKKRIFDSDTIKAAIDGLPSVDLSNDAVLEKKVRQIIDLFIEAGKHYNGVVKKEREANGYSDLLINMLDGTVDAKELGIQYVLDKLKASKNRV